MSTTVVSPSPEKTSGGIFTANRVAAAAAFLTGLAGAVLAATNSFPKTWQATIIAIASIIGAVGTALHFMLGSQKDDANKTQVKLAQLALEKSKVIAQIPATAPTFKGSGLEVVSSKMQKHFDEDAKPNVQSVDDDDYELPTETEGDPVNESEIPGSEMDSDPTPGSGATEEFTQASSQTVERPAELDPSVPFLGPDDPPLESSMTPDPA